MNVVHVKFPQTCNHFFEETTGGNRSEEGGIRQMETRERAETRSGRKQSDLSGLGQDERVWNRRGRKQGIGLRNNAGASQAWSSHNLAESVCSTGGNRCVMTGERES